MSKNTKPFYKISYAQNPEGDFIKDILDLTVFDYPGDIQKAVTCAQSKDITLAKALRDELPQKSELETSKIAVSCIPYNLGLVDPSSWNQQLEISDNKITNQVVFQLRIPENPGQDRLTCDLCFSLRGFCSVISFIALEPREIIDFAQL